MAFRFYFTAATLSLCLAGTCGQSPFSTSPPKTSTPKLDSPVVHKFTGNIEPVSYVIGPDGFKAATDNEVRIVGGSLVEAGDIPWQVRL